MPHLTEARCRACTILGGCTVTERTRDSIAALPELRGSTPEVGDEIELAPCLNEYELAVYERQGRPCPRVELEPGNGEPLRAAQLLMRDDGRIAFPEWFRAACGNWSADRRLTILDRALEALASDRVQAILHPQRE